MMTKLAPLTFPTCGDYRVDLHRIFKDLPKRWTQNYRAVFAADEEAGPIVRETIVLKRELSITIHWTLSIMIGA